MKTQPLTPTTSPTRAQASNPANIKPQPTSTRAAPIALPNRFSNFTMALYHNWQHLSRGDWEIVQGAGGEGLVEQIGPEGVGREGAEGSCRGEDGRALPGPRHPWLARAISILVTKKKQGAP